MEREDKMHQRAAPSTSTTKHQEPEFVLQWGKRLRCVRVKNPSKSIGGIRRRITSRVVSDGSSDPNFSLFNRPSRMVEGSAKAASPEKEERYYTTRGQVGEESLRSNMEVNGYLGCGREEKRNFVLPKIFVTLSSKEKEEDFMAMKGCKLPQRPKKRAKLIQRTLLLVSPGAWLSDMCQERYEVREKKTPKKRPRGLKAMGAMDSDSE